MLNCGTLPSTLVKLTPRLIVDPLFKLEPDSGHPEISVVGIERVGQQRIGRIVCRADEPAIGIVTKGKVTPTGGVSLKQISAFWITSL